MAHFNTIFGANATTSTETCFRLAIPIFPKILPVAVTFPSRNHCNWWPVCFTLACRISSEYAHYPLFLYKVESEED